MVRFLPEETVTEMHDHLIQKHGGEQGYGMRLCLILHSISQSLLCSFQIHCLLLIYWQLPMVFISLKIRRFLMEINVLPALL